jgi:hypothetical protein
MEKRCYEAFTLLAPNVKPQWRAPLARPLQALVSQLWQANFEVFTNLLRHKIFNLIISWHCRHFPVIFVLPNRVPATFPQQNTSILR